MSVLKKNILANYVGSLWTAAMSLICVPFYIHFVGIEAYGLIGIFAALLSVLSLLDMGLSATLNREMARLAVQDGKAQEMRDLIRTLEILYWAAGLIVSAAVILSCRFIAYDWVNVKNLSPRTVQNAVMIMGLAVAFQWPISLYSGGLMGLQRQVLLNGINVLVATFRGLGAVLILWLVSPTIEVFLSWQIVINGVHIGLVAFSLWRSLPCAEELPRFRRELLRSIWRFAAGVTGITMLATLLMQLDKIILSHMLSLETFGYYTLAGVAAMTLYRFVSPVFQATYPRLTSLFALNAPGEVTRLYHESAQLVSLLLAPVAVVVALFSKQIMLLWTQNTATAEHTHRLVGILVIGNTLHGLMNMPYALQLAAGWTRLALIMNLVSVVLLIPLMVVFTKWYGAVGAASIWVILNCGYFLFGPPIMHRRLLPAEKWRWYCADVMRPILGATIVGLVAYRFVSLEGLGPQRQCIVLGGIWAMTIGAAASLAPDLRRVLGKVLASYSSEQKRLRQEAS